jgi:hypothetical protein
MKRYLFLYILLFLFLFYTNGFYTYFYYESEEIQEDFGEFSIARYPHPYESVFLVTVDDISYHTDPDRLELFLSSLEEASIRPTLFVIPYHTEKEVTANTELMKVLADHPLEVAQHGYRHTEKEFKSRSYEEQVVMIQKGREILEREFSIYGFRSPGFYHNFETSKALSDLGFSYESEMSVFDTFYIRELLQMPHTKNGRVFMTHSLDTDITTPENAWAPTMKEFADWWLFRTSLTVSATVKGDELYISLSEYRKGLQITVQGAYTTVHLICGEEIEYERRGSTLII